jgi:hypothetical protein
MAGSYELRADLEAFFVDDGFAQDALDLVGLEIEVGGGREDAGQGGEFLRHEPGDILERVAFDEDEQVEAAAHEEAGLDFAVLRDAMGHAVEAAFALGRDADFDDGLDVGALRSLVVDDGLVGEDDAVVLKLLDALLDVGGRGVQLGGECLVRGESIFLQKT